MESLSPPDDLYKFSVKSMLPNESVRADIFIGSFYHFLTHCHWLQTVSQVNIWYWTVAYSMGKCAAVWKRNIFIIHSLPNHYNHKANKQLVVMNNITYCVTLLREYLSLDCFGWHIALLQTPPQSTFFADQKLIIWFSQVRNSLNTQMRPIYLTKIEVHDDLFYCSAYYSTAP